MPNQKEDTSTQTPIMIDPRMLTNYYSQGGEINLIDLWLSLVKRKKVLFLTIFIVVALAVLYISLAPEIYTYKTDISIGTQSPSQSQSQFIQSPESIVASLDNAIIPKILGQQHQQNPNNELDISASSSKDTDSVLLISKGTAEQKKVISELHQQLISILAKAHHNKVIHTLNYLNDELISLQSRLIVLTEQAKTNTNYNEQITLQIINLENSIRETKQSISQFTETKSSLGTVQSIRPTSKSHNLILVISLVLGLFMGIFAALFAGFLAKVKVQKDS